MDDVDILAHITELIETERELRASDGHGPDGRAQLRRLEESLDQCWDLLRQRRARREFGENPDGAHDRSVSQVEGYLQ